jgi:hypothetical protein
MITVVMHAFAVVRLSQVSEHGLAILTGQYAAVQRTQADGADVPLPIGELAPDDLLLRHLQQRGLQITECCLPTLAAHGAPEVSFPQLTLAGELLLVV